MEQECLFCEKGVLVQGKYKTVLWSCSSCGKVVALGGRPWKTARRESRINFITDAIRGLD